MPGHRGDHHDDPPNHFCCRVRVGGHRPGPRGGAEAPPWPGHRPRQVSGVAYYTVERDGFRVVATLAKKDEDAAPVRVEAVLAPDQSLTLSNPREAGTPP